MRIFPITVVLIFLLNACSPGVKMEQKDGFAPLTRAQEVYVVPFTTIMVPEEVTEGLFDRFVDDLNEANPQAGIDYIILKQGLDAIDTTWLQKRDYVIGEVFAYVEDIGSASASIRTKSRITLYQSGRKEPTLRLDYPVEIFYEKDYTTLEDARRKLAVKISSSMAQKLSEGLAGS